MATALEKQEQMFSLIESWQASGQSQQAFCKMNIPECLTQGFG